MPVSAAGRSRIMKAIKAKDTKPELAVRRLLHRLGYRYRLHRDDLPGKPDLVFVSRAKIIFIHGCFWHAHSAPSCSNGRLPRTNTKYWRRKLRKTVERDSATALWLKRAGWKVLTVWECELANERRLVKRLVRFLG